MTTNALAGLLLGAGIYLSLWLAVIGTRPHAQAAAAQRWRLPDGIDGRRIAVAGAAAVLGGAVTGWPVAGILTAVAVLGLPQLLGRDKKAAARTEKLEAIAVWAEMLRDTLSAAAGLEQAILATAPVAPPALRTEINALSARIEGDKPLGEALRSLADEIEDPVADMVVAALVMAAERQARQLAALLGQLASATREQVSMRLRIDAGRARVRTSVRVITLTTLGMAVGLIVLNRSYLQPYSTSFGQLMLAVVGALFALSSSRIAAGMPGWHPLSLTSVFGHDVASPPTTEQTRSPYRPTSELSIEHGTDSIVAALAAVEKAEFAYVWDLAEITDSALSKQVARLDEEGRVTVEKGQVGRWPRTWLRLTEDGAAAYRRHLAALTAIAGPLR
ncbi:transcriptional regulator [Streptomyces sp. NPDC058746]|uniref:transcriptional regulator n=1 Tax=Streptomyces sp. NPDC058746 TaxID=3346622 RepID=UPI0036877EC8